MYPESSSKAINMNRIDIWGMKTSTLPTPPITPSVSRDLSGPSAMCPATTVPSHPKAESIRFMKGAAQLKID